MSCFPQCAAIDVSIADMAHLPGRRCGPLACGARRRGSRAPGGCAGRRCAARSSAPPRSPLNSGAGRQGAGSRAARHSSGQRARPSHPACRARQIRETRHLRRSSSPMQHPPRANAVLPSRVLYCHLCNLVNFGQFSADSTKFLGLTKVSHVETDPVLPLRDSRSLGRAGAVRRLSKFCRNGVDAMRCDARVRNRKCTRRLGQCRALR